MANKHMKRCSISTAREIQIKFMRNHLTPIRMALTGKKKEEKIRNVKKLEPLFIIGGDIKWCSHYGKQYAGSSKNLKIKLPCDLAIILLNYVQKDLK